ncbi:alpha-L-fucosidase [Lacibacter sp.]|uniref:alpha-L-fucosidase n=1 Tax=Lacibacter sp. TaxID=1915409 RepID=UPI002B4B1508|nr:alpha-L-fucosidase [Lacibacter sp.]HLP38617.1 alpha-L-fucosidase [Lacibacter sp.]
MTKFIFSSAISLVLTIVCFGQNPNPVPTPQQLKWHNSEYYLFAHFGPNTFTDKEWGHGDEPEDIFNPTDLDCHQWCRIAKQAGATGIIITAKHHDGFCLWPSKYSTHTVRESKWKNGKGDVLKELAAACKEYGLNFGVYISPWDRNHPDYGTEKYNDVFVNMMKELFTNYGPITELWWDGANGEGPNGKKQVYDWKRFRETVRKLSPSTVVFSDVGPDIRWVGNEKGIAGTTNWNTLNIEGFTPGLGAPSTDTLNAGNKYGTHWIPAECDVSIRPGWFYHAEEDSKVKSPEDLFQLYLKSVGRGATLLLNVPPDRRGKFHANDSAALVGFKKLRHESFKNELLKNQKQLSIKQNHLLKEVKIELLKPEKINCIVLSENLVTGQACVKFSIFFLNSKKEPLKEIKGTTIGRKRVITFSAVDNVSLISLVIEEQKKTTVIAKIDAYLISDSLIEK